MKRAIGSVILILSSSNLAMASNGSYLIGVTPQSQGMGGGGTGLYTSDGNAIFRNAALLAGSGAPQSGMAEASITKLWPGIRTKYGLYGDERKSTVGIPLVPQVSAGFRPNEIFGVGLGVYTFAGTNLNFENASELDYLKTFASYTRLILGLAAKPNEYFSISISPNIGFGALEINSNEAPFGQSKRKPSKDTAVGLQFAAALFPVKGLTLGAQYSLKQRFQYESIVDLQKFDTTLLSEGGLDSFTVDLPRQFNVGAGYWIEPFQTKIAVDLLWIEWSQAKGTSDLEWRNQHVVTAGLETAVGPNWKIRGGVNYGRSVVTSRKLENGFGLVESQGTEITTQARSSFAVVGFPAQSSAHYTLGAGYTFSALWSADLGIVYSPRKTLSRSGSTLGTGYQYITSGRQFSISGGGTYRF